MSDIVKICRVDGCVKPRHKKSTLCGMHRTRWKTHRSFDLPKKPELPPGILKVCKVHGDLAKEQLQINKRTGRKNLQMRCKKCLYLSCKESNKKHIERVRKTENAHYEKTRERHLALRRKASFGITQDKFTEMLNSQNNLCLICKLPETAILKSRNEIKPLCIDHCHKTGKIRGLLCTRCNSALGFFNDSVERMLSAIEYIKAHQ